MFLEKLNHRKSLQLRLRNLNIRIEKVHAKCWNSRDVVASSPSFSRPAASAPQRADSRATLPVQFLTFPNLLMITDMVYLNDLILTYVNYILLWYYPACARRRVSLWHWRLFTQSHHQSLRILWLRMSLCPWFGTLAVLVVTWDQALFSFRFEKYIPAGKATRKESLIQTFNEMSAAHFFDWLTFAESANQNYFRCLFF